MRRGEPTRLFSWRVRYIVSGALGMAIASFVVVAAAQFTQDQELLVRVAMLLLLAVSLGMSWSWRSIRDPQVFRSRTETWVWVAGNVVSEAVVVTNLFVASAALTVALWVWLVIAPTTIFINVVSEIYKPPRGRHSDETATET